MDTPTPKTIPIVGQTHPMWQFFDTSQLPTEPKEIAQPFSDLAAHIIKTVPQNPEQTVALRKLLEAQDCTFRALFFKYSNQL